MTELKCCSYFAAIFLNNKQNLKLFYVQSNNTRENNFLITLTGILFAILWSCQRNGASCMLNPFAKISYSNLNCK